MGVPEAAREHRKTIAVALRFSMVTRYAAKLLSPGVAYKFLDRRFVDSLSLCGSLARLGMRETMLFYGKIRFESGRKRGRGERVSARVTEAAWNVFPFLRCGERRCGYVSTAPIFRR